MKNIRIVKILFLFLIFSQFSMGNAHEAVTSKLPAACAMPTKIPDGEYKFQQLSWQIFTAANCKDPTGKHPLAWESWPDQDCLKSGKNNCSEVSSRTLRASVLAQKNGVKQNDFVGDDCSPMVASNTRNLPAALKPFIPKNLSIKPKFCEEVHVNKAESDYIIRPLPRMNLQSLAAQGRYAFANHVIEFPKDAIEIKADWIPSNSLTPPFDCNANKPKGVYVEIINGTCYALVGVHISSKLNPKWVWATFEPQNNLTNPNRCNEKLYSACVDPWGSNPQESTGEFTEATQQLKKLMSDAELMPEFMNYRLVGVQSDYGGDQKTGESKYLGNSFVEFNAQVLPRESSCITCHSYAVFNNSKRPDVKENPNFGPFDDKYAVGVPMVPSGWTSQDFSWLLGVMPQKRISNNSNPLERR
ncbi:hypothetical protein [Burkholderia singularis]|uniref:hypothetical protein n=1 Tax=Burkholderia singularis TaxID=1503053 RepID=UPI000A99D8EC|nr:hypothetical protein [Burkholderia singularis]